MHNTFSINPNKSHVISIPVKVVKGEVFKNYTYIIANEITNECILIDPTWEPAKILAIINRLGVVVKSIVLTHSHFDHTSAVQYFVENFGCDVMIAEDEIRYNHYKSKNLIGFDRTINHLEIAGIDIELFHTPGHSRGSTCYLVNDQLYTGDTLFIEGCGMCFSYEKSYEDMYTSLQQIKKIGATTLIYPGHSFGTEPGISMEYVKIKNMYLHFNDFESFYKFRTRKNQKYLFDFK